MRYVKRKRRLPYGVDVGAALLRGIMWGSRVREQAATIRRQNDDIRRLTEEVKRLRKVVVKKTLFQFHAAEPHDVYHCLACGTLSQTPPGRRDLANHKPGCPAE
jgi:hypothetical protein